MCCYLQLRPENPSFALREVIIDPECVRDMSASYAGRYADCCHIMQWDEDDGSVGFAVKLSMRPFRTFSGC